MTILAGDQAELALAAYADLRTGRTADQQTVLQAAGFTELQAAGFAGRRPTVIARFDDQDSGFSTTVFSDATGNLTVAFRGTELKSNDLRSDGDIAVAGAAYEQIIALANWWRRASQPQ